MSTAAPIIIVAFNEPQVTLLTQKTTKSQHEHAPTPLMIRQLYTKRLNGEWWAMEIESKIRKWRQFWTCQNVLTIRLLIVCGPRECVRCILQVHSPIASISFQSWIDCDGWRCCVPHTHTLLQSPCTHRQPTVIRFYFIFPFIYNSVRKCEALQDRSKHCKKQWPGSVQLLLLHLIYFT